MDYASLDLILAILHHLIVFAIFGVIVAELMQVRPGLAGLDLQRLSIYDAVYGVLALLIVVVGFSRAVFAAKGWAYYASNHFFWAKISVFVGIGIISVWPTLKYFAWRRAAKTGSAPAESEIALVRRCLMIELGLFALLPVFAAAMARGG
jgi:putative membrane protein